ncbi:FAD-dependent pyridine nucleotide-disulfide oxidoreductase [Colletotrichum sojae]|uniref:FAD-dependent pyridine nucleotide-disulfide oxidoreductase n=1 Tax=Colletotrichum sojae TaxID=2175907 RepID=A0A8H6J508_9PEZI|nr:FAD-dependent pyridine nucleotide-disulfide oxidoreductase [Colletotrichum sojae]
MVEITSYYLKPTRLVPNSPQPLLHYKGLLASEADRQPVRIHERLDANGWKTQWIFRYGPTQSSHYHSRIHEAMVILSGSATIRFGVADTEDDLNRNTWGGAKEPGGVEVAAAAGDVFVIPAGVAHKTHDTSPEGEGFALLTPGRGRGVPNATEVLSKIELSGFTMMGAYPKNCGNWDFSVGGEDSGNFEESWNVAKPELDPFLGDSADGLL